MPRRERLTYDVDERPRRSLPWGPLLLLVAVVLAATVLVVWLASSARRPAPEVTGAAPTVSAPPPTPSNAAPASAFPSGSDANGGLAAPTGSQEAAARFMGAWLDRDASSRKASLAEVASPALGEELMLTDPDNIPVARLAGSPVLEDASTYSAQFVQGLSTGAKVRVYLVADPGARYRWLATAVEQG